jgi:hypothetical protein
VYLHFHLRLFGIEQRPVEVTLNSLWYLGYQNRGEK